jgi:hypothetical protein
MQTAPAPSRPMPLREQIVVVTRALRGLAVPECRDHAFDLLTRVALTEAWDQRLRGWAAHAIRRA